MPDDDVHSFSGGSKEGHPVQGKWTGKHLARPSIDGSTIELSPMHWNGDHSHSHPHADGKGNVEGKQQEDEGKEDEKPVVILSPKMRKVHAFLNRKQEVIL